MQNFFFIAVLASALGILYYLAFKHLPCERWQILGIIPLRKQANGQWQGLNLTYYGLINASAVTFALVLTCILLAAIGLPLKTMVITVCGLLLFCTPGAKWMARWVEKKKHTFTIGGAAFCGLVGSPLLLLVLEQAASPFDIACPPLLPTLTAVAIGYTFGEGSGRLACLSFGCCYGKPIDTLPAAVQRLAAPFSMVFHGRIKKAVYAGGLDGHRIIAIQAITAVLYAAAGLLGIHLFLQADYKAAYLLCILATQIWRILSELMRADYRGGGRISTYQYLAGISALAAVVYSVILPASSLQADLSQGLRILWHPTIIVTCQVLWLGIFLFTGRSKVTAARVSFFVRSDRI